MIDIHCHLLPGVDDGPSTLEESLQMLAIAKADGCTDVIATPHLRHELYPNEDLGPINSSYEALRKAAPAGIRVHLGGEIAVHSQSFDDLLLRPQELLTLAGSPYILLEPEYHPIGPSLVEVVYEVAIRKKVPIVAHPERIPWLAADLGLVHALVEHGAHLQLTASSVIGSSGPRIAEVCRQWIDRGWVTYIASDAHGPTWRPPGLSEASRYVSKRWSQEIAAKLFSKNARKLFEHNPSRIHP